jgi:hypothetical protein
MDKSKYSDFSIVNDAYYEKSPVTGVLPVNRRLKNS